MRETRCKREYEASRNSCRDPACYRGAGECELSGPDSRSMRQRATKYARGDATDVGGAAPVVGNRHDRAIKINWAEPTCQGLLARLLLWFIAVALAAADLQLTASVTDDSCCWPYCCWGSDISLIRRAGSHGVLWLPRGLPSSALRFAPQC